MFHYYGCIITHMWFFKNLNWVAFLLKTHIKLTEIEVSPYSAHVPTLRVSMEFHGVIARGQ